jgi:signal transduction histidine kinase
MRRSSVIFLVVILVPSLVLAALAVHSARDQQIILEHQQATISQDVTDALAKRVQSQLDGSTAEFVQTTQRLLAESQSPRQLANNFNQKLQATWKLADVGFAVDVSGAIYSPLPWQGTRAAIFLNETGRFLSNRENVPVFSKSKEQQLTQLGFVAPQNASQSAQQQTVPNDPNAQNAQQIQRQVSPLNAPIPQQSTLSNTLPSESDFRRLIKDQTTGAVARFLEDKLRVMVWYRPPGAGSLVFGAQLAQPKLVATLTPLLQSPDLPRNPSSGGSGSNYCLAILDDRGKPVAISRPGFRGDWKHPFVATEVGEGLPHWEAALYLLDTQQIRRSATTLQLTLGSIVFALISSILLGGWLMATDVRRQMRLAQQKTDFVSNVSHELKTPLTSIKMFADMLVDGRANDPGRRTQYLRIIAAESSRLTRLINNVLDFARLERGGVSRERCACDLVEIAREVIDTCRPHLEEANVAVSLEIGTASLPLVADRDALAQIILNLVSNAEKYGGGNILVRLRREDGYPSGTGCVDVLDRGPGIPAKQLGKIFEPFHRLEDSLASGVSGSGLGLTLARRMAQVHGGNVTYSPPEGGGSCFTLRLPLQPSIETQ